MVHWLPETIRPGKSRTRTNVVHWAPKLNASPLVRCIPLLWTKHSFVLPKSANASRQEKALYFPRECVIVSCWERHGSLGGQAQAQSQLV